MGLFEWLFVWTGVGKPPPKRRPKRRDKDGRGHARAVAESDRRRVPRFAGLGARVIIDATEYDVVDWTPNSFRIAGYDGDLIERQIVHFRFLLVYREETWEWPGVGRVVRTAEGGILAVLFRTPEEPFRTRLNNVVAALRLRDSMTQQDGS